MPFSFLNPPSIPSLAACRRITGLSLSAQAFFVQNEAARTGLPFLVLCPDEEAAAGLQADLLSMGAGEVLFFPGWEQSPYSPVSPSLRVRLQRLRALATLRRWQHESSEKSRLLITTPQAALQFTLPQAVFTENCLSLAVGAPLLEGRDDLLARLSASGYLRVETVEDPGTFALRGEIIDIFPPDRDQPVRIELFDVEIERIRPFDPGSQRVLPYATQTIPQLVIPPAREVLLNGSTCPQLRSRLKEYADEAGIPRSKRDPILSAVTPGIHPEHSDAWAPFAYGQCDTLFQSVPPNWPVVAFDPDSLLLSYEAFLEEQRAAATQNAGGPLILPPVDQLFAPTSELRSFLTRNLRIELYRFLSPTLETQPHEQVSTEPIQSYFPRSTQARDLSSAVPTLQTWRAQGVRIAIFCPSASRLQRMQALLNQHGMQSGILLLEGSIQEGFFWLQEAVSLIDDSELLGQSSKKRVAKLKEASTSEWAGLQALTDLEVGDPVVHVEQGIGRYRGLSRISAAGVENDFLVLEYANRDKLYLPVYRLNQIQKYAGGDKAPLDKLGTAQFEKKKEKVREAVQKLAFDLVQLYAERKIRPGIPLGPRETEYVAFEESFPFQETADQTRAIDAVLSDLESGQSMDRLVCGDVGFGKTEVAIRAAFLAAQSGRQVAVLVPTTILALQHEQSFRARFKNTPFRVDSLSRFKTQKQQKGTLASLKAGGCDIVIGTHRLLSKDVEFKDLALVIIDEEHRFGVEHKERLRAMRVNTHILTLTATPIPRTLHMALSGLRDISTMSTPPVDRLPIRTYVSSDQEEVILRAIQTELSRGGQVYYLNNRIEDLPKLAATLQKAFPDCRPGIAHGQMPEGALEQAMMLFYEGKTNVLLCTTIIESGLDVPNANTIIVSRADTFGLAQLYQIRGRVGRSTQRAYAYLLVPNEATLTADAQKRLEVIQRFVELGSGFNIASHDLEIRGGGELLGPQQSGHIATVGYELYTQLLEEAILELKGKEEALERAAPEPEIKASFSALLSDVYVSDMHQRLSLYRRLSAAPDEAALTALEEELSERFGPPPQEAVTLFWLIRIKQMLKAHRIPALTVGAGRVTLSIPDSSLLDSSRAIALIAAKPSEFQIHPDSKFTARISTGSAEELHRSLEGLLERLGSKVIS